MSKNLSWKTNPFGWHIYTLTREYLPSINHLAIVFPIPVAVLSYKNHGKWLNRLTELDVEVLW